MSEEEVIEYAAHAECASSHPIAKSVRAAWGGEPDRRRVTDIREHSGRGITARVDGRTVAAGNVKLMERLGIPCTECHEPGTIVHMAIDSSYAGHIVISDREKPEAKEAIVALKNAGVRRTVMLTGDRQSVGDAVAQELNVDHVYAELLPQIKVEKVEELLSELPLKAGKNAKLAFVGDGINDAPVLSRADVGIAMGSLGSDAAIEAADVVIMDDNLRKIPVVMRIARKTVGISTGNIIFALAVKLLILLLGALGYANMWAAVFADVGVAVLCILNSMRLLMRKQFRLPE